MLQQTTVAAVAPRYRRFLARWPDVAALAAAPPADVMAEWAGLGYYSRARNLIACAREVAARGGFPASEAELRALPGVGDYTAAAVAAIAFGQRAVVVDGNVERVVARLFAIDTPLPTARKAIRAAADRITPEERPGDFAQAMMDLGATTCVPRGPKCLLCPLAALCAARQQGAQEELPVRLARRARPERRGSAFWIERDGKVLLVTRPIKGTLGGMRALPDDGWSVRADGSGEPPMAGAWEALGTVRHGFTHFALKLAVLAHRGPLPRDLPEGEWVATGDLSAAGLPRLFAMAAELALGRGLDDAAAQHQPDHRYRQHHEAEIAPAVGAGEHARGDTGDCDWQHEPVAPAEERDGRGDRQQQGDGPEDDRDKIQHSVLSK
jgi:A/G-specific adenine glycosylase